MFTNDYQYEDYTPSIMDCEDGEHQIKIVKAEYVTTKNNNNAILVSLLVQHSNNVLYKDYYVEGEYFNKSISRFFDAFGIAPGDFNLRGWIGKKGRAFFEKVEDSYTKNGEIKKSVKSQKKYFCIDNSQPAQQRPQAPQQNNPYNNQTQTNRNTYQPNTSNPYTQNNNSYANQNNSLLDDNGEEIPF